MSNVSDPIKPSPTEPKSLGFRFALTLGMKAGFTSVFSAGAGLVLPNIEAHWLVTVFPSS